MENNDSNYTNKTNGNVKTNSQSGNKSQKANLNVKSNENTQLNNSTNSDTIISNHDDSFTSCSSSSPPTPQLNKIKKRVLMLSPTVEACLERELSKSDFFRDGDKAIGKGGFGEVWKVVYKKTNKTYVIKVIDKKNIIEQKMVEQMNREIDIMYKINHPHVIKLINHFEDDEKFYLIMAYASKGQLYSYLKRKSRFDQRTAAQYMRESLAAVQYLHSFNPPIIHRDIKPENLLLDDYGRIKLADFGWSNFKDDEKSRVTYCGTPEYLSPEMVRKQGHDTTVDIWSLGVLLFEFLAGHAPFTGSSQEELFHNIKKLKINWPGDFPPLAKNLITKVLKINPKERITIDEILAHSWFEKNAPIKPVLTTTPMDKKQLLESHLISIAADTVTDQINELVGNINPANIKSSITKARLQNGYGNNHNRTGSNDSVLKSMVNQLQSENDQLTKENKDIKLKLSQIENELKSHKLENIKLKEQVNSQEYNREIQKLTEELEKYKIMNKERLDLLTEIEEKNNQIFDLNNINKSLENEHQGLIRDITQFKNRCADHHKIMEENEIKITELKMKNNELMNEKGEISNSYQKKLMVLQNKMIDNTSYDSDSTDETHSSSSHSVTRVIEMMNDSINEMTVLFKMKISTLTELILDLKELQYKSEFNLVSLIKDKASSVMEILTKLRGALGDDLANVRIKISKENTRKNVEMIDWLKKQINELQPYKNKVLSMENKTAQNEALIKQLQNKIQDIIIKADTNDKLIVLKESKIKEASLYAENLEAKLSDVKDFVFKNCSDQLDSFNNVFNGYFS